MSFVTHLPPSAYHATEITSVGVLPPSRGEAQWCDKLNLSDCQGEGPREVETMVSPLAQIPKSQDQSKFNRKEDEQEDLRWRVAW